MRRPDMTGPTLILGTAVKLMVTFARELFYVTVAEVRFRVRRAALRRDWDTMTEDRVA